MKILHVGATHPPYHGGMGNVMYEEAVRLQARGHAVSVLTLALKGSEPGVSREESVTVHRVKAQIPWTRAGLALGMIKHVRDTSYDMMHVHIPFFGLQEMMAIMMWLGWRPKNLVVSYHMDIVASGFIKYVAAVSRRFFMHTVLRRARAIFVASKGYACNSWLADKDRNLTKLVQAPFGTDLDRFKPDGHARGSVVELRFLGGLDSNHYFKGVEVALRALAQLKERTDWNLKIGGDGDLREGYEHLARELGLADRVSFGRVSDEALPGHYASGDLFLFPSIDRSEAFGLVAVEAMASGLPVIASDLDGVRDVVEDGVTGWLVRPGDVQDLKRAIENALDNKPELPQMGVAARERAKVLYSWDNHVDDLEISYRELCAS